MNNFLNPIREQFLELWNSASRAARTAMVVTGVLCTAAVLAVAYWSSQPEYVPLASSLTPSEAAEFVSRLDSEGILAKLNFSGSTVSVPRTQWNRARLATSDVETANGTVEDLSGSFLDDPTQRDYRQVRHLEKKLAATIGQMDGVNRATVHITMPKKSPFAHDREPPSASIMLDLKRGRRFQHEQSATIVAMMTGSIEGLGDDDVSVVDTAGRLLSQNVSGPAAVIAANYQHRREFEADLASRAQQMLDRMLGQNRASVLVAADLDFNEEETIESKVDPDIKAKVEEDSQSSTITSANPDPIGPAGTASNIGTGATSANRVATTEKTENLVTKYENSRIETKTVIAPGQILRLTVSVMVDLHEGEAEDTGSATGVTTDDVQKLVENAVGFDEDRGDTITVVETAFAGVPVPIDLTIPPVDIWERWQELFRAASLGIAALVALLLGILIIRRTRPVVVTEEPANLMTPERARHIAELTSEAVENPDAVSHIIAAWLNEPVVETEGDSDGASDQQRAQAEVDDAPPEQLAA